MTVLALTDVELSRGALAYYRSAPTAAHKFPSLVDVPPRSASVLQYLSC